MKIGMNMLLWAPVVGEEHFPLFERLKQTGFDGVEIPIHENAVEDYRKLGDHLDSLGLERTGTLALPPHQDPISADAGERAAALERMRGAAERTAALGGTVIAGPFHSAYAVFSGAGPTADEKRRSAEVMHASAEAAGAAGVSLACEFLNRFECYLLNTAADARELVRAVDHPSFSMLYDTHHAHIEEQDVADAILSSATEIGHVHVSENDRGVPGRGLVDWATTFRCLKEIGYDGWLMIEAFSRLDPQFAAAVHIWRDFSNDPDEVQRDGFTFVRDRWAEQG
ncbi:MAG: sugar phosphate isomerase/epimerase [Planctomycetota bacterium]|nr:sugar phosphate isomerase/epimerase [Planctomycetota bacterium]MDP6989675.1 sugar phosphate isomerase/epimerase [Planctomycetota bacterium]